MERLESPYEMPTESPVLPAVPISQPPLAKFREFLDVKGLKCTGGRLKIVEHIFEKHNHFEADQLLASMQAKRLRVSRSTIYRTLSLLVEAGLLRELRFGERTAYEHDYGYPHHDHFYCDRCGSVTEFVDNELDQVLEDIGREFRFRIKRRHLVLHGVCEKCDREGAGRRRTQLNI